MKTALVLLVLGVAACSRTPDIMDSGLVDAATDMITGDLAIRTDMASSPAYDRCEAVCAKTSTCFPGSDPSCASSCTADAGTSCPNGAGSFTCQYACTMKSCSDFLACLQDCPTCN